MPFLLVSFAMSALCALTPAHAAQNYTPQDISQITNTGVEALIKEVAIGGSHKAYLPARPLGYNLGVDIAITADVIVLNQDFKDSLALVTGTPASQLPSMVPLPKLAIYKGLPMGFDLGFSYVAYQDLFKSFGAAVRWGRTLGGPAGVSVGAQLSGNYTKVYFLDTHTYSIDAVISKDFFAIEPYFGAGLEMWSGNLTFPVTAGSFQTNVTGSKSGTTPHVYFGLPIKMFVMRLTAQVDYSFASILTYGVKLAFNF